MSDLRIIREYKPLALLESSIPIDEIEWVAGTYSQGDLRYIGEELYEVAATSTADSPTEGVAHEVTGGTNTWIHIGKINRFRMFDDILENQSTMDGTMSFVVSVPQDVISVAMFGLTGTSVEVVCYDGPLETDETYRREIHLTNTGEVRDWGAYYRTRPRYTDRCVDLGLPAMGTSRVRITIEGDGQTGLGKVIFGEPWNVGRMLLPYRAGARSRSTIELDTYGRWKLIKRRAARTVEYPLMVESLFMDTVLRRLAEVDAVPTVFLGDEGAPETIIIGLHRDYDMGRKSHTHAEMQLLVEEL